MKLASVASFVFALLPAHASALSCGTWSIAHAYQSAAKSEYTYTIVLGNSSFDREALPLIADRKTTGTSGGLAVFEPKDKHIPARVEGLALAEDGFSKPYEADVTLHVTCVAQWCGHMLHRS